MYVSHNKNKITWKKQTKDVFFHILFLVNYHRNPMKQRDCCEDDSTMTTSTRLSHKLCRLSSITAVVVTDKLQKSEKWEELSEECWIGTLQYQKDTLLSELCVDRKSRHTMAMASSHHWSVTSDYTSLHQCPECVSENMWLNINN